MLGRFDEAETLYQKSVDLSRELAGETSSVYANALLGLSKNHIARYQFDSALPILERAMATAAAAGADPGGETVRSLLQLAQISNLQREYVRAESLARQAIDQSQFLGRLSALSVQRELAVSLSGQERIDEAEQLFATVFDALSELDPEDNVSVLPYLLDATDHHLRAGQHSAALVHAERAWRISLAIEPQSAWRAALARGAYGRALLASGSDSQAQPLLRQAFSDLENVFGTADPRVQQLRLLLAADL